MGAQGPALTGPQPAGARLALQRVGCMWQGNGMAQVALAHASHVLMGPWTPYNGPAKDPAQVA